MCFKSGRPRNLEQHALAAAITLVEAKRQLPPPPLCLIFRIGIRPNY